MIHVEQVFRTSGVPTHTFVRPVEFDRLKIALRAPGRGVVIEGPSGIGKSTAVAKALGEIGAPTEVRTLSARRPADVSRIAALSEAQDFGTVVIDDFHRLDERVKRALADLLKLLADAEDESRKIIIVGINKAGHALIDSAADLSNRVDVVRFEVEPASKVADLVSQGCAALGIQIAARDQIVSAAAGSFHLAQILCLEACVQAGCLDAPDEPTVIDVPYEDVRDRVMARQADRFGGVLRDFARGPVFRPAGRAPFVHILRWLAESPDWSISLREEIRKHPTEKASVGVAVEQGILRRLTQKGDTAALLYFDQARSTLSIEDPTLAFYLRNLDWPRFVREVGFTKVDHAEAYDVALSFAGEDREVAEFLVAGLQDLGHAVFYDRSEQHEILASNVEEYLRPIYESGSRYVVVVLGPQYGLKRWTMFEASIYRNRIDTGHVIPVRSNGMPSEPFDRLRDIGQLVFNPKLNLWPQAREIAAVISRKLHSA